MVVYQIVDDALMDNLVYWTKEAAGLRLLEIVMAAPDGSKLNDLLRVEVLEVKACPI